MQGLKNLGATCAINSLIQIICRNKYLRESIIDTDIDNNTFTIELKELLKIMHIDNNSVSPNKFISKLFNIFNDNFHYGQQIDITELYFLTFDKIFNETNISIPKLTYDKKYDNMSLNDNLINEKANYIINNINNFKTNKLQENTQGVILNIIECNDCNYNSYNFEPFIALQLDLPNNNNENISLTELLRQYLKPITEKTGWICDKCKKSTVHTKSFKLWSLPKVLIFLIKRYNLNSKNNKPVDINQNINIRKGCILVDNNLEMKYYINSIGMHIGNLDSGHYFAICKNEIDNKFILYDDLNIKIFNKDNKNFLKKNSEAYMVVYSV